MANGVRIFGLFSVAALAGAIACTTTTTETSGGGDPDAGKKDGSTSTKDSGTKTDDEDSGTTKATGDDACKEETTLDACGSCCEGNHEKGTNTFYGSLLACACEGTGAVDAGGKGACDAECGDNACAEKDPTDACVKCVQDSIGEDGACLDAVVEACKADDDCMANQQCLAEQCDGKK
jgi:hypothetical protein